MLSVGLCLSARLPAGLLVFFGFVGSFGSIDHRLQQFELLPCGAVQTVDFFDHIVGVGGCDPFSEFVPSLFRFGVMYHHFNGGHSFAWLTHLRLHRYHLIFTGYWLSAIRCGFRSTPFASKNAPRQTAHKVVRVDSSTFFVVLRFICVLLFADI